ncbi:hypothetical protein H0H87_003585 [Tephrocybe sp. NHM501043]|nr:hypothetical protein H0H87_003585 [Tephrocybe sp. NHM501043]
MAHGYVSKITIDRKVFKGYEPQSKKTNTIIRPISNQNPVKGADNVDINCGPGALPVNEAGEAKPGSKLSFQWSTTNSGSHWIHDTGPLLTYMASCEQTSCDSTKAKWFKIDQQGRKPGGGWVQDDIMKGQPAHVILPKTLAPGNYLIRHEIIALHVAQQRLGAEFYPSCAQLKISGAETGKPTESELVHFPGAYTDDDPGILTPHLFDNNKYDFPGPPIAAFVSQSSTNTDKTSPLSSAPSSTPGNAIHPSTITDTVTASPSATVTSNKSDNHKLKRKRRTSSSSHISLAISSLSEISSTAASVATSTSMVDAQARRLEGSRLFRRRVIPGL